MPATIERTGLVSIAAVVDATGLDGATVRGHCERGEWPGLRVGRSGVWRLPRRVIEMLLAGRDPREMRGDSAA